MSSIRIQVAPRVGPANPRGAQVAAALFVLLGGMFAKLRHGLSAPAKSPAQEAQALRQLAIREQRVDPRFAADLFAAADRHERLHGSD